MGTRSKTRGPSSSWWWLEGNNEGGLISPIYSLYIYMYVYTYFLQHTLTPKSTESLMLLKWLSQVNRGRRLDKFSVTASQRMQDNMLRIHFLGEGLQGP